MYIFLKVNLEVEFIIYPDNICMLISKWKDAEYFKNSFVEMSPHLHKLTLLG